VPAELIAADFHIAELRAERLRAVATDTDRANLETELDRALPFNCEHVVPQSWFNKEEPMRGDLHHLFACESRCTRFRGNTPYAEFPDFSELVDQVVRTECGKSERNGFEPGFGKGAAARAVLYFLIRYPHAISDTELPPNRIGVLLAWHEHDPVSEWERHRNAAIFARQSNRNPLIDHPEWAAEVISQLQD
jgi:endonuclease I